MDKISTIFPGALDHAVLTWIQELSPYGVCITDTELTVQGWNLWMESASGLKREDVIGRKLIDLFPELTSRRLDRHFANALKGEVSVLSTVLHKYLFPFPTPVADSSVGHMLQTARIGPLIVQGTQVVGTITTIEDVTQREHQQLQLRKQTERQELFSWALAHLLRSSDPDAMVKQVFPRISAQMTVDVYFNYMLEDDGKTLRLNSAAGIPPALKRQVALRNVGQSLCEASDPRTGTFVFGDLHESDDERVALQRQIGLRAYVCHPLQVEDKIIGTLSFGSRIRNSFEPEEIEFTRVVAQYVGIAIERSRTIHALRNAQEELKLYAKSLDEKVQERTAKLQESINELESFSYSLAHDVRAPLRHIYGYSQLLMEDCEASMSEQAKNYVGSIMRSIQKLDALTKDILAYTQVSRQSIQTAAVDLDALLKDLAARNPALSEPDVLTIKRPLENVRGERLLLGQCISNLLDNSLKFISPGTAPRIIVSTESRIDSSVNPARKTVRVWVEDNGVGIAPDYHEKIFNIFERLSNHTQGTGIGLAIVAKAVQKMGGQFGVESDIGRGSKFWIELPSAE